MSEPEFREVMARDVVPYAWGVWSSICEGKPFVNEVMGVRWSEDGKQIILGLDSHNFYFADADEMLSLVPIPEKPHRAGRPPFVLGPPPPKKTTCPHCGADTKKEQE